MPSIEPDVARRAKDKIQKNILAFGDPDIIAYIRYQKEIEALADKAKRCKLCSGAGQVRDICMECDGSGKVLEKCDCQK